jgi:ParB-like chromosome segregation protein Spo0J
VDNLTLDPANARRGDVAAIRRSLTVFGQRKPVVAKRTGADAAGRPAGIVIAGNHTLSAALELGWTELAAVFVEDDEHTARAYALADNRTGELATWDYEQLAETLAALSDVDGLDLADLGWKDYELEGLLAASWTKPEPAEDLTEFSNGKRHAVSVTADAWAVILAALDRAREDTADPAMTDEAALVHVSAHYLQPR